MIVKELIERLQSLDPDLEVYITNQEETHLTQIDFVIPCVDYGETVDDNEFVAIFPKPVPNNSNIEKMEYRNLSQETANCNNFTLPAEEVELVRQALLTEKNVVIDIHCKYPAIDDYIIPTRDKINNLLTRIKQWQERNKV